MKKEKDYDVTPVTPAELAKEQEDSIPSFVIRAVNNLLRERFDGSSATLLVSEVEAEICRLSGGAFKKHWMNFEKFFRPYWDVHLDTPGWDENYKSHYKFRKR